MNEKRLQELMNRELDGDNSPDESAALRSHLAASEEARAMFDELVRMSALFREAGEVTPPRDMESRIVDAIAARDAAAGRERGFFLDFLSPRRKVAYAFAAGIAVGIVIFVIVDQTLRGGSQLDVRDLYGALAEREQAGAVIDAQSADIAVPGCSGTAIVQFRAEAVFVSASIAVDAGVEVEIAPLGGLALRSFRVPACGPYALRGSPEGVAVSAAGPCEFVAVFADPGRERPPIRISVTRGGSALFEKTVELGRN